MAHTNLPFPDRCPSFVSPGFQSWNHMEISATSGCPNKHGEPCILFLSNTLMAKMLWPLTWVADPYHCHLCPWILPSGLPRSTLLWPLGACTCFPSLSGCTSKYKLLSLNSSPALYIRSFIVLSCQAVELWTLEAGVHRKRVLSGTTPSMPTYPRKWWDTRSVLMEGAGKLQCINK